MRDLLQRARPTANAYDVVLTSVDGYVDSFPIAKAMEPETLLVYLMNGKTLPQDHGYPVRVLVPNIYGMKNVKWLRSIEVATFDKLGYWQEGGWSDGAIVNTGTRIDIPARTLKWDGGAVTIAGIAFAGARGIGKVEISFDSGRTLADREARGAGRTADVAPLVDAVDAAERRHAHPAGALDRWSRRYRDAGEPSAVPERRVRLPRAAGERQPLARRYFVRGGRQ